MKAVFAKLILYLSRDRKTAKKLLIILISVIIGLLGAACLPFIVLHSMSRTDAPEINTDSLNQEDLLSGLDTEKMAHMEETGQSIADAMSALGLQEQTIKAQLIYLSFFEDGEIMDFSQYAGAFSYPDDRTVIACLNETYGLQISYEDFMRSYALVMNVTINPYLFTNAETKNAADLAAWARNAWVSGWGFESGAEGEINPELRYRTADNIGLIMGYLNYHPDEKSFKNDYDTLFYTPHSIPETMPDVPGLGVFNDDEFGIYIGNGEVIFCCESIGHDEKTTPGCGLWINWCTFDAVDYPQEVWDWIDELNTPEKEPEQNQEEEE